MARYGARDELDAISREAESPGDRSVVKDLRESGARTARERIRELLDDGSFVEIDAFVKHRSGDADCTYTPLGRSGCWARNDRWTEGCLLLAGLLCLFRNNGGDARKKDSKSG